MIDRLDYHPSIYHKLIKLQNSTKTTTTKIPNPDYKSKFQICQFIHVQCLTSRKRMYAKKLETSVGCSLKNFQLFKRNFTVAHTATAKIKN
jgi:hypothetical protein